MMPPKKSKAARALDEPAPEPKDQNGAPASEEPEKKNIFKVEIIHTKRERTVPQHETHFQSW